MSPVRLLAGIPLAAIAAVLLALGVVDLWIAAFGGTGDTARQVPLVFGVLFVFGGVLCGLGALAVWRLAGRLRSGRPSAAPSGHSTARSK